eukprot:442950_1
MCRSKRQSICDWWMPTLMTKMNKTNANYSDNTTKNTNTSLKRMDNNGEYGVCDDVCAQNRSKCIANTIRFSATPRTALCIEYPTATPTIALCIEYFDFWTAADGVGCDSVIEQLQQCLHRIEECKDPSPTHTEHQQYPANQRQDTVAVKEKRHSIFSTFSWLRGSGCVYQFVFFGVQWYFSILAIFT